MRLCVPCTVADSARASCVLPVPGKSSRSMWPSESRPVSARRVTCYLPRTAFSMLPTSSSNVCANQVTCACVMRPVAGVAVMGVVLLSCVSSMWGYAGWLGRGAAARFAASAPRVLGGRVLFDRAGAGHGDRLVRVAEELARVVASVRRSVRAGRPVVGLGPPADRAADAALEVLQLVADVVAVRAALLALVRVEAPGRATGGALVDAEHLRVRLRVRRAGDVGRPGA